MMPLLILTLIISVYVMFESISAIAKMPGGMIHFCHKIKYVLSFSSSIAFIYFALQYFYIHNSPGLWLVFGSAGTLAFFVWPRTVYRFRQFNQMLDDFESGEWL